MTIHAEYPTPTGDEMNAIDDLRESIRRENLGGISKTEIYEWLTECADRIEHEYMERPKDADGMPCKISDLVDCDDGDFTIDGLKLWNGEWWVFHENGLQNKAASCHHVKPDSWEQIEADACKKYMNYFGCSGFACADCPSKINGAKPYSRYETDGCELAMRLDIVRRCKALSERGA